MKSILKTAALGATATFTLGLGVVAAPEAEAASISCGQPVYSPEFEAVVHSCDGIGLLKYTIDCTWPPDVTFTYRWDSSASSLLPYTCNGRGEWSVSYEIVE